MDARDDEPGKYRQLEYGDFWHGNHSTKLRYLELQSLECHGCESDNKFYEQRSNEGPYDRTFPGFPFPLFRRLDILWYGQSFRLFPYDEFPIVGKNGDAYSENRYWLAIFPTPRIYHQRR
jgi:hypothetical protein